MPAGAVVSASAGAAFPSLAFAAIAGASLVAVAATLASASRTTSSSSLSASWTGVPLVPVYAVSLPKASSSISPRPKICNSSPFCCTATLALKRRSRSSACGTAISLQNPSA